MATNKRKEAAALFELLDKSTLKIPKNAGALKIPAWWSSKSNPPATTTHGIPSTLAAASTGEPLAQEDLPSDTPPVPEPVTAAAAVPTTTPAKASASATAAVRPVAKAAVGALTAPAPRRTSRGVFAPQTVDPNASSAKLLTRPRIIVLAGLGVGLVLLLIVWGMSHNANTKPTYPSMIKPAATGTATGGQAVNNNLVGRTDNRLTHPLPPPPGPQTRQAVVPPKPPLPPPEPFPTLKPARVYGAAEAQRQPNLYYLVICSAANEAIAGKNAEFIAQNGIGVSIEKKSNGMFTLISVDGFAKLDDKAADAFRKKAIDIGKDHPDAKKQRRSVYYDAYYARISRK